MKASTPLIVDVDQSIRDWWASERASERRRDRELFCARLKERAASVLVGGYKYEKKKKRRRVCELMKLFFA